MKCCTVGLFALVTLGLLVVPLLADAQQAGKVYRIGNLGLGRGNRQNLEALRHGLRERGWVEGQNVVNELRFAEGKREQLPALVAELVQLRVDVIVTSGAAATRAAKEATSTIPVVQAMGGGLVAAGLVTNLAQPGGNITGLSIQDTEIGGKRLELLMQVVP